MRSALIVILVMLCANLAAIYIVYNLTPVPFTTTDYESESSLIIDEGDELEVQWQYKTLNHSIFEKLAMKTNIKNDMQFYNQNDIIEWDLSIVENQDDETRNYYCEVIRDEYKRTGDYKQYISSHKYRIYEKPELYLFSMFRDDNYFTHRLIPIEVDEFIQSLNYYIYNYEDEAWFLKRSKNYTLETNSINSIIKLIKNNTNYQEVFSYNEEGILRDHVVYYKNQTAMKLKLIKFEIDKLEPQRPLINRFFLISQLLNLLLISTTIEIIITIVLISTYNDSPKSPNNKILVRKTSSSSNKNNNPPLKDNRQLIRSGNSSQRPIIKLQPCSNCQTLLDLNSNFCHNCGKQRGSEADICQFCGKRKLKDAKYCIECGHLI